MDDTQIVQRHLAASGFRAVDGPWGIRVRLVDGVMLVAFASVELSNSQIRIVTSEVAISGRRARQFAEDVWDIAQKVTGDD